MWLKGWCCRFHGACVFPTRSTWCLTSSKCCLLMEDVGKIIGGLLVAQISKTVHGNFTVFLIVLHLTLRQKGKSLPFGSLDVK